MLLMLFSAGVAACLPIHGDVITGRDLAAASPAFASVPEDTVVGYAPAPGHRRMLYPPELQRFAEVPPGMPPVCFEWPLVELSKDRVLEAMQAALGDASAEIEIAEMCRYPVPEGKVNFSLPGLSRGSMTGPSIWRGQVEYGRNRRFEIWARVKVGVSFTRVVAAADIKTGDIIRAEDLRLEEGKGPPGRAVYASRIEEAAGRTARRSFEKGAPLALTSLGPARDVAKGDSVQVEARSGKAKLVLEGRAEAAGAVGDMITVRNAATGKTFRARIESAGHVVVESGAARGGS